MQRTTGPCIPYIPFVRLVREIAQDVAVPTHGEVEFEAEALRLMQAMLEDRLVKLFRDANLICLEHGGGSTVHTFPFAGFETHEEHPYGYCGFEGSHRLAAVTCKYLRAAWWGGDLKCEFEYFSF